MRQASAVTQSGELRGRKSLGGEAPDEAVPEFDFAFVFGFDASDTGVIGPHDRNNKTTIVSKSSAA